MRLFISADIEGTCGIVDWDETELRKPEYYNGFADQMTAEVAAACNAALSSGRVDEILIKDAHDYARNIKMAELPEKAKLIRGWVGGPGGMMAGVTKCDACIMTGYHSGAFSEGNPLAHTMNTENQWIKINGEYASEFIINAYFAAYYNKPVLFISGDLALCNSAKKMIPGIETAAVSEGEGGASVSVNPQTALRMITDGVTEAMSRDFSTCMVELPDHFSVQIQFKEVKKAQRGSWYPGAKRIDAKTIDFESDDYFEIVRFLYFVL
jgi:D-amino peptidase